MEQNARINIALFCAPVQSYIQRPVGRKLPFPAPNPDHSNQQASPVAQNLASHDVLLKSLVKMVQ